MLRWLPLMISAELGVFHQQQITDLRAKQDKETGRLNNEKGPKWRTQTPS